MVFVLPDKVDGLKELESKLSSVDMSKELCTYDKPMVTVQIPKFKMETTVDLNTILQQVLLLLYIIPLDGKLIMCEFGLTQLIVFRFIYYICIHSFSLYIIFK